MPEIELRPGDRQAISFIVDYVDRFKNELSPGGRKALVVELLKCLKEEVQQLKNGGRPS